MLKHTLTVFMRWMGIKAHLRGTTTLSMPGHYCKQVFAEVLRNLLLHSS